MTSQNPGSEVYSDSYRLDSLISDSYYKQIRL
jgi:hypothetical protein